MVKICILWHPVQPLKIKFFIYFLGTMRKHSRNNEEKAGYKTESE